MTGDAWAVRNRIENEICRTTLEIAGQGVKLYWMDTSVLADQEVYDRAYQMLSPWRREKADFYLNMPDRRLSAGAGLLLQRGLADCGVGEKEAKISFEQYGKPYLPEHPEIHFNLSHAGNQAVAVFADTEAGCDVEQVKKADMELAERFFCAGEYAYLARLREGEARDTAFYRFWTLKESFVKAVGLGLGKLPPDSFEIELLPGEAACVRQKADKAEYGLWGWCGAGICIGVCVRA